MYESYFMDKDDLLRLSDQSERGGGLGLYSLSYLSSYVTLMVSLSDIISYSAACGQYYKRYAGTL